MILYTSCKVALNLDIYDIPLEEFEEILKKRLEKIDVLGDSQIHFDIGKIKIILHEREETK